MRSAGSNLMKPAVVLRPAVLLNQGIGALLLAHAMRALALPIRLYTFQANAGARRFYERHGFVPLEFTDGQANEEHCPDVLYELQAIRAEA